MQVPYRDLFLLTVAPCVVTKLFNYSTLGKFRDEYENTIGAAFCSKRMNVEGKSVVLVSRVVHWGCEAVNREAVLECLYLCSHILKLCSSNHIQGVWDTAGAEKFEAMSRQYIRNSDAGLICYDINDHGSFEKAKHWVSLVGLLLIDSFRLENEYNLVVLACFKPKVVRCTALNSPGTP